MQTHEDVQAMLELAALNWGTSRVSRELGCSRNTLRSYLMDSTHSCLHVGQLVRVQVKNRAEIDT